MTTTKEENKIQRQKARRFLGYCVKLRNQYLEQLLIPTTLPEDKTKIKHQLNTLNNDIADLATDWFDKSYDKEDEWETVKQTTTEG